jgi:hypothetical protein
VLLHSKVVVTVDFVLIFPTIQHYSTTAKCYNHSGLKNNQISLFLVASMTGTG